MNKILTFCLLIILLSHSRPGLCSSGSASLQPPATGSSYQASEVLLLTLPSGLSQELLSALVVELDNIDVSALVSRAPGKMSYQPLVPLKSGKHSFRLVHYAEDGSVTELGYWELEVRQSSGFSEAWLKGELQLELSRRVSSSGSAELAQSRNSLVQGGGQFSGALAGSGWRTESYLNLTYADDPSMSLTGREADISSFYIRSTAGRMVINMGDQVLAVADLLHDGFQRRGLASSVTLPSLKSQVQFYGASANQRVGIDGGLGLSDSNNFMSGARWQYQALSNSLAHIVLSSGYVSGKVNQADFATIQLQTEPSEVVKEGAAWNQVIDALLFDKHLRMRIESAQSRYDFDGINFGFSEQDDSANSGLIILNMKSKQAQKPLNLQMGVEKQKIGTYYKSVANQQLPADKEYLRSFIVGSRDKWSWNSSIAEERNNLEENTSYAKTYTRQWVVGGGYQQYKGPQKASLFAWLGKPAVNCSASGVEIEDQSTPVGYIPNDVSTRNANINAIFSHKTWNWSLGVNQDRLQDHSGWQAKTRTRSLLFNTSMQISKYHYLAFGWQLQKTRFVDLSRETNRQLYSLEARSEFVPGKVSANISIGLNQNNAEQDPYFALRDKSSFLSANVNWKIKKPKKNRLGLDLSLSLIRNEYTDYINTITNSDGYQVFLKLSTTLPTVLPGITP